ncbi:MAG TPA: DUF4387 domain-containing protein [Candidatus Elarobacter sp.]
MPKLRDVATHVRSKNAGPFWVTVDVFFADDRTYRTYRDDPALGAATFARMFGTDAAQVKRFPLDALNVVKISYPRPHPQGGAVERDMHAGQQAHYLLDLELGSPI